MPHARQRAAKRSALLMLETQIAGQAVLLHPSGAMLLQDSRCLLVADAHFGKAVSFRTWGMPVPRGTTTATLERLSEVLRETGAQRLVFLGDFLHSRRATRGHSHDHITNQPERFRGFARQSHSFTAKLFRAFCSFQHVLRLSTGTDGDKDVAGLCKSGDLARKDLFVAKIVADGG